MKKLLLSMAAAALALTATATTVCFNADGNTYSGDASKVITISGGTTADGLSASDFTVPGALTLKFGLGSNTNSNYPGVGTWKHARVYTGNTVTFTPMTGVTITGIKFRFTGNSYAKNFTCSDNNGTFAISGSEGTWNGSSTKAVELVGTATCRFYYIEVTYTGGMKAVAEPTFSIEDSFVEAGSTVALSCATDGAEIHYTLDGTTPDASSTTYSAPITINGHVVINAIAIKAGAANSNVVTGNYGVLYAPAGSVVAEYNFADVTTLNPAQEKPAVSGEIAVNDLSFTAGETITLSFDKGEAGTDCRIYNSASEVTTLRTYTNSSVTFTATNAVINNIEFSADPFGLTPEVGYVIGAVWSAENAGVASVTFKSAGNSTISEIKVNYTKTQDGVADIAVEAAEGEVEYFNLQGVRVAEPAAGLYLRRQGNTVTKVIVK